MDVIAVARGDGQVRERRPEACRPPVEHLDGQKGMARCPSQQFPLECSLQAGTKSLGHIMDREVRVQHTGPCAGLAVWSITQAATWHSSCARVSSSRSARSSTLADSSTRALYLCAQMRVAPTS